jgi:hypothetical protein
VQFDALDWTIPIVELHRQSLEHLESIQLLLLTEEQSLPLLSVVSFEEGWLSLVVDGVFVVPETNVVDSIGIKPATIVFLFTEEVQLEPGDKRFYGVLNIELEDRKWHIEEFSDRSGLVFSFFVDCDPISLVFFGFHSLLKLTDLFLPISFV